MKIKNTILSVFVLSTLFVFATPANASLPIRQEIKNTIRETVEEGKDEGLSPAAIRKEVRENVREEVKERKGNIFDKVKDFIKKKVRFDARITGTIATMSENSMTVTGEDGKTYTLSLTSDTKLVRRFGGKSEIGEFSVGNKVNVFGTFTDGSQTTIDVKMIRNVSIQKKWGVFFGKVASKSDDRFVIESSARGSQTVFTSGAKFKMRNEKEMTYTELAVGNMVRVKGMWDRSSNEITEVNEVKDFSLPAQPVKD
ncbi:MAG: DUF5666 domain-containing protein [Patescibacteria group bacterium]